jgi:hypothetical protein
LPHGTVSAPEKYPRDSPTEGPQKLADRNYQISLARQHCLLQGVEEGGI